MLLIKKYSYSFFILLFDLVIYFSALWVAVKLRVYSDKLLDEKMLFQFDYWHFVDIWWLPVIFIFSMMYHGLYNRHLPFVEEAKRIIISVFFSLLIAFTIISLGKLSNLVSRLTISYLFIILFLLLPFYRLWINKLMYFFGLGVERVLIIGAGNAGVATAHELLTETNLRLQPVGFIDDNKKQGSKIKIKDIDFSILGTNQNLSQILNEFKIQSVIIAIPSLDRDRLAMMTARIQTMVKSIIVIPELTGVAMMNSELYQLFMQQLFMIKIKNNLNYLHNKLLKNIFDYTVSFLLLPFLLLAIFVIAVFIKVDSRGPVFFAQKRVGHNGKFIKVFKFRTMFKNAEQKLEQLLKTDKKAKKEWDKYYKLKNDPRVTKVGNFLRKTSLDELPQIFNVLSGSMSLVGPRPVLNKEIEMYYKEFAHYYKLVKPGVTGLWQVSGRNNTDYPFRVGMDTWYVLNWSLWFDLVILMKTIKVVIKREGAY